jgi:anti-anti-sigma factor
LKGELVVDWTGEADLLVAPILKVALDAEIGESAPETVVQMTGLKFIDASGLGVLIVAAA